jgi:tetratricopeptide (TPR) repeat protein
LTGSQTRLNGQVGEPRGQSPHRVAEVIAIGSDGVERRGSGYRISDTAVLTARHAVDGATSITLRFSADRADEWTTDGSVAWSNKKTDVAVLKIEPEHDKQGLGFALCGRLGDRSAVLEVHAVGFPLWKKRVDPEGRPYRDSHHAVGHLAVLSNRRSRTLEVTITPPENDPDPARSPWEGMSGAAVFVGPYLVGIVSEHHRREGLGRLTAASLEEAFRGLSQDEHTRLRGFLGLADSVTLVDVVPLPPTWWTRSGYREKIADIAPAGSLLGRQTELDEMARFCAGSESYMWWRGEPWTGKSALMSTFALHPPAGVDVVSFFVTARLAAESDSNSFVDALIDQLLAILDESVPVGQMPTSRDAVWRSLLARVLDRCKQIGRRAVLIVDGLDEDRGTRPGSGLPSIASLLPKRVGENLRIIVAGRPDPELPVDVSDDHPLRTCRVRMLSASPYAASVQSRARQELDELLAADGPHRAVLGLIAASGGGLAIPDLEELTDLPRFVLDSLVGGVFGRTVGARSDDTAKPSQSVLLFTHETLREECERRIGHRALAAYQSRLHQWATVYESRGWPANTPTYLLRRYSRMLVDAGDHARLLSLASDSSRHHRMREATGGDSLALTEIGVALDAISSLPAPNLDATALLIYYRHVLNQRNVALPADVLVAWETMGNESRVDALLGSLQASTQRSTAVGAVAVAAARRGNIDRAVILAQDLEKPRSAHYDIARATIDHQRYHRAIEVVRALADPEDAALGLVIVARCLARKGQVELAESTASSIMIEGQHVQALAAIAEELSVAGDLPRALHNAYEAARIARRIDDDFWGQFSRSLAGQSLAAVGQMEEAKALVDPCWCSAEPASNPILLHTSEWERAVVGAANLFTRTGNYDKAEEILNDPEYRAHQQKTHQHHDAESRIVEAVRSGNIGFIESVCDSGDLGRAVAWTREITDGETALYALEHLLPALAIAGRLAELEEIALAVIDRKMSGVHDDTRRAKAFVLLARTLASAGEIRYAEDLVSSIADPYARADGYAAISQACALAGDLPTASTFAHRAEGSAQVAWIPEWRSAAAVHMVRASIATGDLQSARSLSEAISEGIRKDEALSALTRAMADRQLFDEAVTIADSVEEVKTKRGAMLRVANAAIKEGSLYQAEDVLSRMRRTVEHAWTTLSLARALARRGSFRHALALIYDLPDEWQGVAYKINSNWHEICFSHLAEELASAGNTNRAEALISSITDGFQHAEALLLVARAAMNQGDRVRAEAYAATAENLARDTETDLGGPRETALSNLASAFATMGYMERAEQVARSTGPAYQSAALEDIIDVAIGASDLVTAERLLAELHPASESLKPILASLAVAWTLRGDVARAVNIADSSKVKDSQPAILGPVVEALARLGDFPEAETVARAIENAESQAEAFAAIARHKEMDVIYGSTALRLGNWNTFMQLLPEIAPGAVFGIVDRFVRESAI